MKLLTKKQIFDLQTKYSNVNEIAMNVYSNYYNYRKLKHPELETPQNWYESIEGWTLLCNHYYNDIEFIRDFKDQINWYEISRYIELNKNNIEEFGDYIDWNEIIRHRRRDYDELPKEIKIKIRLKYL